MSDDDDDELQRAVERDWLAGHKLTAIAARYDMAPAELYRRLRDHPARQARWN